MNIYYYKVTGLDIKLFWKNILSISWIPLIMIIGTILISNYINFYYPANFLIGVIIYSLIYLSANYIISMNDYEKDIFRKPLLKIINKIVRK